MAPEIEPNFSGKVVKVLLGVSDAKWNWWSVDEPTFELQHGRLFLVGKLTIPNPGESFWGSKHTACVPWNSIWVYLVEAIVDRQQRKYGEPDCNTIAG
jgi:hypothetical protein